MIYRGPGFLPSYYFAPPPLILPSLVSNLSVFLSLFVIELADGRGRRKGVVEEPNHTTMKIEEPGLL
jgi:hypothetical protein